MTLEQAMQKATDELDDQIANMIEKAKAMLSRHGATEAEVSSYLAQYEPELLAWRNKTRADLRAWLAREGATLQ